MDVDDPAEGAAVCEVGLRSLGRQSELLPQSVLHHRVPRGVQRHPRDAHRTCCF